MDSIINDGLKETWLERSPSNQLDLFCDAFRQVEASQSTNNMGLLSLTVRRWDCPELCRDNLTSCGGLGFLDLLESLVLDDIEKAPTQPVLLPNPRFDDLIGWRDDDRNDRRRIWLGLRRQMRTDYIRKYILIPVSW